MDVAEMKRIATELLFASESGDVATADRLTNDDFHFQFMEKRDSWTVDGKEVSSRLDKENFLKYGVPAVNEITVDGMHFKTNVTIGEGNYVAIFGESNATSKKGRKYNNNYCWRFTFSGDKVSEFQEYCDTHHAREVLFE